MGTADERILDNDRSARRRARQKREGFARLLELAEIGAVAAVIVDDLDRRSRNPDELAAWITAAELTLGVKH